MALSHRCWHGRISHFRAFSPLTQPTSGDPSDRWRCNRHDHVQWQLAGPVMHRQRNATAGNLVSLRFPRRRRQKRAPIGFKNAPRRRLTSFLLTFRSIDRPAGRPTERTSVRRMLTVRFSLDRATRLPFSESNSVELRQMAAPRARRKHATTH